VTVTFALAACTTVTLLATLATPAALAQGQPSPTAAPRRLGTLEPARETMLRNRYHVRQMESVLVRAVEHAAEVMTHRLTTVSPDVMALAGSPRAQGFRIDGYGLFFAVEVPRLSDSMNWALQVLANSYDERTLSSLQRLAEAQTDPVLRADLERAMRSLQRQIGRVAPAEQARTTGLRPPLPPGSYPERQVSATTTRPSASSIDDGAAQPPPPASSSPPSTTAAPAPVPSPDDAATAVDTTLISNPSAAYEDEVKSALSDALLDYALTLPLAPGEWVTVAARDAGYIAFPDAVAEMVTVTLSVKVDDLLELRVQRIDRDEARRRVIVREF
jgi:hypothetical protein